VRTCRPQTVNCACGGEDGRKNHKGISSGKAPSYCKGNFAFRAAKFQVAKREYSAGEVHLTLDLTVKRGGPYRPEGRARDYGRRKGEGFLEENHTAATWGPEAHGIREGIKVPESGKREDSGKSHMTKKKRGGEGVNLLTGAPATARVL